MMKLRSRLSVGIAVLAAIISQPIPAQTAAAGATYVVNDDSGPCGAYTALTYIGAGTLQTAVTDAIQNKVSTVLVCPGTYNPFVVTGATKLTIKAAVAGSYPVINAPAQPSGEVIRIEPGTKPSTGVVIDGLKVDGANFDNTLSGDTSGIAFVNSSGTVQNSIITGMRDQPNMVLGNNGWGISAVDDNNDGKTSTLVVKASKITDNQSASIVAAGPVKVTVTGNTMVGNFSGGGVKAIYGVNLYGGATGTVRSNIISQIWVGVRLFGVSNAAISGNTITNVDSIGVQIIGMCIAGFNSSNSNKITGNSLSDINGDGISVIPDSTVSGCTIHLDKNTVSGNFMSGTVTGTGTGIEIGLSGSMVPPPSVEKNKITNNTIMNFPTGIVNAAASTQVSMNTYIP